jgi:hypothetical protein
VDVNPKIPDSVITQYDFEDDSDTSTAIDTVGTNDGTITGAAYDTDARCGSLSMYFDGTDDGIESKNSVDLMGVGTANEASIATFIKPQNIPTTSLNLLSGPVWVVDSDNFFGQRIIVRDSGSTVNYNAVIQVGGTEVNINATTTPSETSYQHQAVTVDSNEIRILIDGSVENSTTHDLDLSTMGTGYYELGSGSFFTDFEGYLDNPTVADSVLTESEVQQLINRCA